MFHYPLPSLIKSRITATPVLFSSLPSLFFALLPLFFLPLSTSSLLFLSSSPLFRSSPSPLPPYPRQCAHEPAATHRCPKANQGHGEQTRQGGRCYKVHYRTHNSQNHYMHYISISSFSCLSRWCISTVLWRQTPSCV